MKNITENTKVSDAIQLTLINNENSLIIKRCLNKLCIHHKFMRTFITDQIHSIKTSNESNIVNYHKFPKNSKFDFEFKFSE